MSTHPVNVSGISPSTTEAQLHDFFTIDRIETPEKSTAVIHFEKSSAAKTALMLNGGTLDGATLSVTSDVAHQDEEKTSKDPLDQSDKPRAGIAAEYLAKGYVLSDHILERAIEMDNKQGISKRFLNYFHSLDTSLGARTLGPDQTISGKVQETVTAAAQQAKTVDEQKGISKAATDYYTRAIASPLGQKVRSFYTSTSKQVQDIHEEARRIAEQHKLAEHKDPATSTGTSGEKTETTGGSEEKPSTST
ncbi:hypothetical protein D9615_002819 [Tricholomella constricta]|uniref:RRM domain-containing protein n=1 Tax=Tricholomella constricta TaxID=117010 RepID=A0A8H5M6M2_9AGAR|nr:hypothetical protein D9615_002819 [Tricholomella constricta]